MYYRNGLSASLATAVLFLLTFSSLLPGSRYAAAQTSIPIQTIQAPALPSSAERIAVFTPHAVRQGAALSVGHYNPNQSLRLALNLQPPHLAEEDQFIKELVTKGSPNFHKFLTQDQWNARFAPSVENEEAVVNWAQSVGLTVTKRYPNRLLVDVEGAAGTIEKAFGVTINNYQMGDETDFSNDRDPVIPASLSGILSGIAGLNSIERVHRIGSSHKTVKGADYVAGPAISELGSVHGAGDPTKAPGARATTANVSAAHTSLSAHDSYPLDDKNSTYAMDPDNIQSSEAYNYNALQRFSACCNEPGVSGGSPPESSIALVGYGGFNVPDIQTFFGAYGMAYLINWYCIDGSTCPSNDGEAPLDIEYSGAMSNNYGSEYDTAHIFEYEMTNDLWSTYEDAYNDVLSDGHAKVLSTSYGGNEDPNSTSAGLETGTMHSIFNNMVAAGITLIAASGDNGAADGCGAETAVDYPSSDPDFIAAGGTQLSLYTDGTFYSETAWQGEFWNGACGNNHGGSTGGRSVLFGAPYWQSMTNSTTYKTGVESPYYEWQTVNGTTTEYIVTGNTNRLVPDLSLTANPDVLGEWYVSNGSWQDEGGTSIVAPELAGFFAQENSYLDKIGNVCGSGSTACSPVGLASPFIYDDAVYGAPHNPFYDMTSGCNNNDVTVANNLVYYCAYTGYDPITGWGSANMMQLAWGINWELIPAYGNPSLSFGGPATSTWFNSDQIVDWDLNDAGSGGLPAPGALGFTAGWDSIPSDPSSEPHGGQGNSFYSGPQYLSTFGCVDNNGTYCEAASGQGCHTVYVEGWDNQGRTTVGSYGPVCYDSVAPTISASTNPATSYTTWVDKSVVVSLAATDPGGSNASGIAKTYYAINTGACSPSTLTSCAVYNGPLTISAQGHTYIYYFTEDKAGNFSTEPYIYVSIDTTLPVTTAHLSGTINSGSIYKTDVQVTLSATAGGSGVQKIYYELDGGAQTAYTGPLTVAALGGHTIKYWAVSNSGETGTAQTTTFSIASPTTATLAASPNPALLGSSVKMTATVKATLSGTPTGSVTFWNGSTQLDTATLSSGVATFSTTTLPAGTLALHVSYAGAGNFLSSTSATLDEKVTEKTTTTVTSSLNPAEYGEKITFTATVKPSVSGTPTGTVSFKNGSTIIGTGTLSASGIATLAITTLPVGADSITADYAGDSTYVASNSAALTETVNKATTTTTVASSLNPAVYGATVTFTAKVTAAFGSIPTGTVSFKSGSTIIGTETLSTSGVVTLATSTLPVGANSITADYNGSTDDSASDSAALTETIDKATTTTTVTSSLNPATHGTAVTFTAKVIAGSGSIPTGTVSFKSGSTIIGGGTLSTSGVATLTTSVLPVGANSITADYSGSTNDLASNSAALTETIDKATTTTTLTSSLNPATHGTVVTFTAKVTAGSGSVPTGTVSFKNGSTTIGSGTLSTSGIATLATSTLPIGTDSITADYAGSTIDLASNSSTVSQVIK